MPLGWGPILGLPLRPSGDAGSQRQCVKEPILQGYEDTINQVNNQIDIKLLYCVSAGRCTYILCTLPPRCPRVSESTGPPMRLPRNEGRSHEVIQLQTVQFKSKTTLLAGIRRIDRETRPLRELLPAQCCTTYQFRI